MSAKWRMVLWFTLMMLLLAGVTLTFVLVMNGSVIANPTSQVVKEVSRRADDIEFDNGTFDWDDMKEYKHGVYCTYYDTGGTYLRGAMPFAEAVALPLQTGAVRPYSADGRSTASIRRSSRTRSRRSSGRPAAASPHISKRSTA